MFTSKYPTVSHKQNVQLLSIVAKYVNYAIACWNHTVSRKDFSSFCWRDVVYAVSILQMAFGLGSAACAYEWRLISVALNERSHEVVVVKRSTSRFEFFISSSINGHKFHRKGKTGSYITQYPVLSTVQSALHFTPLTDLFTQTHISASLGSIHPYATINARRLFAHTSTTVYSQILIYTAEWTGAMLSEKLAQCFFTITQDSNPDSRSRESEALPMSHCAL